MRNFFSRMLYSVSRFLQGRYGIDDLFLPLVVISCVCTLISSFWKLDILRLLSSLLLLYAVFRVCSKNYPKRQKELQFYQKHKNKITRAFRLRRRMWQERHEKRYFKCPNCKTYLSVPKGKGKLQINCRKCGHQFIRKS